MPVERVCWLVEPEEPGCYMSVDFIRAAGTEVEIGQGLAEFARREYGVDALGKYTDAKYARARLDYYQRNWPEMADRVGGVAAAFGEDPGKSDLDASALVYDMAPGTRGPIGMGCSAAFLPKGLVKNGKNGGPIVARNFDAWRVLPSASTLFSHVGPSERPCYSRSFILELRPRGGLNLIALGGHDLLFPFQDALNEAGLFVTTLADQVPPVSRHMALSGGENSGLSSRQLLLLIAGHCRTVAEAKQMVLRHQVRQDFALHWLIADKSGDATVLELDTHGCFVFTDPPAPNEPLFVTNHQLNRDGRRRELARFVGRLATRVSENNENWRPGDYESFVRLDLLMRADRKHRQKTPVYAREDIERVLLDPVACSYHDYRKAGVPPHLNTRTIWSLTADLSKREIDIRFYLKDCNDMPVRDNRKAIAWRRWRLGIGGRPKEPRLLSPEVVSQAS